MQAAGFVQDLVDAGLTHFYGVPDSLLSGLITAIAQHPDTHLEITASEGAAVALAMGYHLGTGRRAVVFMQNSGLGNAVNPLTSLAHPDVYGIPMLMLIGWRGETGQDGQIADEPQHKFQGVITPAMLDLLEVPYVELGPNDTRANAIAAISGPTEFRCNSDKSPKAILIRKGTFSGPDWPVSPTGDLPSREAAIQVALAELDGVPIVATTGKISREVYELQQAQPIGGPAFLTVGGLGHAAMIACGVAAGRSGKVACFDGDGAVLMHTGSLASTSACNALIHICFNNQCHDSVGGQPTSAPGLVLADLARATGYSLARRVNSLEALQATVKNAYFCDHSTFIEVMVAPGARSDLGRPKHTPHAAKETFMKALK